MRQVGEGQVKDSPLGVRFIERFHLFLKIFEYKAHLADREAMKRAFRFIPKKLRHSLYRKSISLDFLEAKDIHFKIAESQDELEQAFRLVYQVHQQKNLVSVNSSELKLSKSHLLPTTKVLIGVKNEKVVSSLCLSLEGPLRTACEEQFDLSNLKAHNKCFVEISNFVFDSDSCEDFKTHLFPLCKLAVELNKIFFKADYFVLAMLPEYFDYWHSLFFLEKLSDKSVRFQELNGRAAVCAFADIKKLEAQFLARYGKKTARSNLHKYFFADVDARFKNLNAFDIVRQRYTPQILNYFFNIKTNIFSHLTSFEIRTIHKIYDENEYEEVLPNVGFRTKFENQRNSKRHHTHLTGKISGEHSIKAEFPITIKTVSLHGVGAVCPHKLQNESTYHMLVDIGEKTQIALLVSPVWSSRDQTYGFLIRNQSPDWMSFVETFNKEQKKAS